MNNFNEYRLALRKHILLNKNKIKGDLITMRKKSNGIDLYTYVNILENKYWKYGK